MRAFPYCGPNAQRPKDGELQNVHFLENRLGLGTETYYVLALGTMAESQGKDTVAGKAIFQVNEAGAEE
jgi:hypothetical protein